MSDVQTEAANRADSRTSNVGLDALRGGAALLVVLGHAREILFKAQDLPVGGTGWQRLLLAPTSVAQEAVAVFFVLSGYLVGGQVLRQVRRGEFRWGGYLIKRLSRLWTVLIPGLVLTAGVDLLSRTASPATYSMYTASENSSPLSTFLCNAMFLQRARCATFGSNDALWSLSYEFWFYIAFAAAAGLSAGRSAAYRCACAIVLVAVLAVFGWRLLLLIPAWLLGVVLADIHRRLRETRREALLSSHRLRTASAILLIAALGISNLSAPTDAIRFALIGASACPLILILAALDPQPQAALPRRLWCSFSSLGPWSYSLYVFHLPIAVLIAVLLRDAGQSDRIASTVVVYCVAVIAVVSSYPLSRLTERHTSRVRGQLLEAFGQR